MNHWRIFGSAKYTSYLKPRISHAVKLCLELICTYDNVTDEANFELKTCLTLVNDYHGLIESRLKHKNSCNESCGTHCEGMVQILGDIHATYDSYRETNCLRCKNGRKCIAFFNNWFFYYKYGITIRQAETCKMAKKSLSQAPMFNALIDDARTIVSSVVESQRNESIIPDKINCTQSGIELNCNIPSRPDLNPFLKDFGEVSGIFTLP